MTDLFPPELPRGSATQTRILPALLQAQAAFTPIKRKQVGNIDRGEGAEIYRYATLSDHFEAILKPLNDAGILITQDVVSADGGYHWISTRLTHAASGEWLAGHLPIQRPVADDPQVAGSRLTYGRRYALQVMLGLAPQYDDDDGAVAREDVAGRPARQPRRKAEPATAETPHADASPAQPPAPPKPSPNQTIQALLGAVAHAQDPGALWLDHEAFLREISSTMLEDLVDRYVAIRGGAPPVIEGLAYPEGIGSAP